MENGTVCQWYFLFCSRFLFICCSIVFVKVFIGTLIVFFLLVFKRNFADWIFILLQVFGMFPKNVIFFFLFLEKEVVEKSGKTAQWTKLSLDYQRQKLSLNL